MKIGKIPENILRRTVFQQLRCKRPEVLLHAGEGEDCTALAAGDGEAVVLTTDPITGTVQEIGELAVHVTVNDLASSGAEPVGILATLLLPEGTEEEELKKLMFRLEQAASSLGIEIMGGHTEVTDAVNRTVVSITGVGRVPRDRLVTTSGAKPGQDIIMTKWTGLEGTMILAKELLKLSDRTGICRLTEPFLRQASDWSKYLSVLPEARIARDYEVTSMHDVTEGGIFGALWEMGEASGVGFVIPFDAIPVRQETIEICECFSINPYMLVSSGCMLMTTARGGELVGALHEAGIEAAVIGHVRKGKDRVILLGDGKRYLEPPGADELYKGIRGIQHGIEK